MPNQESEFFRFRKIFENFGPEIWRRMIKGNKHMKTITNLIYVALAAVALGCFALPPAAHATKPPKPEDRGNGNSAAENVDALNPATTGSENTAHGWSSLFSNDTGSF